MLKWLHSFFAPISFILKYPDEISFHYVTHSYDPDEIQVYYGGRRIYSYWWIDGQRAYEKTRLYKIHRLFLRND